MEYRLLANAVLLLHLLFIVFVVGGGFLALRWPRLAWLHLPAALWGAAIEFRGWICPLTPLENHYRRLAGEAGYSGGFIEHYLWPLIYPAQLSGKHQAILGAAVVIINLVIYVWIWRRRRGGGASPV